MTSCEIPVRRVDSGGQRSHGYATAGFGLGEAKLTVDWHFRKTTITLRISIQKTKYTTTGRLSVILWHRTNQNVHILRTLGIIREYHSTFWIRCGECWNTGPTPLHIPVLAGTMTFSRPLLGPFTAAILAYWFAWRTCLLADIVGPEHISCTPFLSKCQTPAVGA